MLPPPYDEGYADDDDTHFTGIDAGDPGINIDSIYGPLYENSNLYGQGPSWGFNNVPKDHDDEDDAFEDAASDAPNMGSRAGEDLDSRMLEDFGDDMGTGIQPGLSTPLEEEVPVLLGGEHGDGDVANVVLDDEPHAKID